MVRVVNYLLFAKLLHINYTAFFYDHEYYKYDKYDIFP